MREVRDMVDIVYARGWDDCLEAVQKILQETQDIKKIKTKIGALQKLVKENKFEKIKYELGAFDIF